MEPEFITQIWPLSVIWGIAMINANRNPVLLHLNVREINHAIWPHKCICACEGVRRGAGENKVLTDDVLKTDFFLFLFFFPTQ